MITNEIDPKAVLEELCTSSLEGIRSALQEDFPELAKTTGIIVMMANEVGLSITSNLTPDAARLVMNTAAEKANFNEPRRIRTSETP